MGYWCGGLRLWRNFCFVFYVWSYCTCLFMCAGFVCNVDELYGGSGSPVQNCPGGQQGTFALPAIFGSTCIVYTSVLPGCYAECLKSRHQIFLCVWIDWILSIEEWQPSFLRFMRRKKCMKLYFSTVGTQTCEFPRTLIFLNLTSVKGRRLWATWSW